MRQHKLIVFLLMVTHSLASANYEGLLSLKALEKDIHEFLEQKIHQQMPTQENAVITIRALDSRLRLIECDRRLTFELQASTLRRHNTVKVSCNGTRPWSIFSNATLQLYQNIVTINRELPKKHVLTETDLSYKKRDIFVLRNGYSTRKSQFLGKQLKRPLRRGSIIYNHHLQLPDIVNKGDTVKLTSTMGGLSVITPGIALKGGSLGDRIRVENQRSERVVFGKIIAPGVIEIY